MKAPEVRSLQVQRDRELVRDLLRNDERAFHRFVEEYFAKLYRYARIRLNREEDVEEVVQNTLSNAARRLYSWRGDATLLTWLISICRHEVSRQLQRDGRHRQESPYLSHEGLRAVVECIEASPGEEPVAQSQRSELLSLIQVALDQLPERYAQALEWKYIEGLSSREIAARFDLGDEAVQSLLARARRAFRGAFDASVETLSGI